MSEIVNEAVSNIPGRVHSAATNHIVTGANEIYDDDKHKRQSEINAEQEALNAKIPVYTETTWAALKALRDNSQLVPGAWYRITDYLTTVLSVVEPNARSAGHAFDVIVRADSANVLNEDAYAALRAGDTYFSSSNLAAWKLKYTLDNVKWSLRPITMVTSNEGKDDYFSFIESGTIELDGKTYILWTGDDNFHYWYGSYAVSEGSEEGTTLYYYDNNYGEISYDVGKIESKTIFTDSGKGTITWMKDEFGNELSYDFKNIQFKRYYTSDSKGRSSIANCYMVADPNNPAKNLSVNDTENYIWAYTFSSNAGGDTQTDTSLGGSITNNIIGSNNDSLPNNVFYGTIIYSNTFGDYCYNNSIGNNCFKNSIGYKFYNNSIGNSFQYNIIGNQCYCNFIGNSCNNNTIGYSFYNNFIGNDCFNNSIGKQCYSNSIGNSCNSNTIGNSFQYNIIGNYCRNIRIQKDYVYYIIIENGNRYLDITSTRTTSSAYPLSNITIAQGVQNNSTNIKTISRNDIGEFQIIYKRNNSEVISVV